MEVKKVSTINPDNYVGKECKIIKAEYVSYKTGPCLKIIGENMELVDGDSMPDNKTLNPSNLFSFKVETETGDIIIPEGGKLHNWLKSHKIKPDILPEYKDGTEVSGLIGVKCIVQKNLKNGYLDLI